MTRSTTASIGISILAVLLHGSPVLAEDHPAEASPVSVAPPVVALEEAMVAAAAAVEQSVVTLEIHGNSSSLQGLPQGMERFFPMDGLGSGFLSMTKERAIIDDMDPCVSHACAGLAPGCRGRSVGRGASGGGVERAPTAGCRRRSART